MNLVEAHMLSRHLVFDLQKTRLLCILRFRFELWHCNESVPLTKASSCDLSKWFHWEGAYLWLLYYRFVISHSLLLNQGVSLRAPSFCNWETHVLIKKIKVYACHMGRLARSGAEGEIQQTCAKIESLCYSGLCFMWLPWSSQEKQEVTERWSLLLRKGCSSLLILVSPGTTNKMFI